MRYYLLVLLRKVYSWHELPHFDFSVSGVFVNRHKINIAIFGFGDMPFFVVDIRSTIYIGSVALGVKMNCMSFVDFHAL